MRNFVSNLLQVTFVLVLSEEIDTNSGQPHYNGLQMPRHSSDVGAFYFMKFKKWSDFKVHCSGIGLIMSRPRNLRDLKPASKQKYANLLEKDKDDLTDKEKVELDYLHARMERFTNPELSQTAIKYLMGRYAWEKYNKKTAPTGFGHSSVAKGNQLEDEAIEIISGIDKIQYTKHMDSCSNEYIGGRCDVLSASTNKVIDVKTAWSINSFLPHLQDKLDRKFWFQMQGYLEIYNMDYGEVCFILLNTPPHLIDRERAKYTEKYVFGEITRDKYDEEMEKFDLCYNYNKIPVKRRVIRHIVKRDSDIIPQIYRKVEKCRDWLNDFEKLHMRNKSIITLPEQYFNESKEDNSESDTTDTC